MRANTSLNVSRAVACGVLFAGVGGAASAQSVSPAQSLLDSSFVGNLGGFILSTDTKARLNGASTSNPDVDFDQTFGKASDSTRIRADVLWRITPTHHLRFMYFDNSIDRSRVIDRNVEWGDLQFQAGGRVDAQTDLKIGELAYEYAFIRQPGFELAGSAGLHVTDISVRLSGNATVRDANGNVSPATFNTKESSVTAPLPVFGLRAGWVVAPQWYVDAQGQIFKAKFGDYDARVLDLRAGVTWMYNRNFGIGLGYNRFTTTVDVDKPSFDGRLRVGYSGFQLFLTGAF